MRFLSMAFLLAFLIPKLAWAAAFCITAGDVAGLQAALQTTETNGEDDVIQLQIGDYSLTSSLNSESLESHSLTIEGGYGEFFGNPCGLSPQTSDATQTRIDGAASYSIYLNPLGGSLILRGITIKNTFVGDQFPFAAVRLESGATGSAENDIFSDNAAIHGNGVKVDSINVEIKNALFYGNSSWSGDASVLVYSSNFSDAVAVVIANSTFANNLSSFAALEISQASTSSASVIANSLFWGNSGSDAAFYTSAYLTNDDITYYDGQITQSTGLVSISPFFKNSPAGDFSLKDDSPLRDMGASNGFVWWPGDWDVRGKPRTSGVMPDVGAFEIQDVIFANGFDI